MEKWPRHARTEEKGFALISVLWALSILSLIAAGISAAGTVSYKIQHNIGERAKGMAFAEAGVNRAILALLDSQAANRWPIDGRTIPFLFEGKPISLRIQDESGRIDLNFAPEAVLIRLLADAGVPDGEAELIVGRIVALRIPDISAQGAPSNVNADVPRRPFLVKDEVRLIEGMTAAIFQRIAPAITIYSGRTDIDRRTAPVEALRVQPGMNADLAIEKIVERTRDIGDMSGGIEDTPDLAGRAFSITAEVPMPDGAVRQEAVVMITGDSQRPFLVMEWK